MDKLSDEYWKLVCERDAAWDDYCKHPTDEFYSLYQQALEAENRALAELLASEEWQREVGA